MTKTVPLCYEERGTGEPTFVLIHGITGDHTDWRPQFEFLSKFNRVIAPTLRGHGGQTCKSASLSMENLAADVVSLMREKAVEKAIVAGHSMGTRVVYEVATQAPEMVSAIALVDGSYVPFSDLDAAIEGFDSSTANDKLKTWLKSFIDEMFVDVSPLELRGHCIARALAMSNEAVRSLYRNMMVWDTKLGAERMARVTVPTLVIQSTKRSKDGRRSVLAEGETGPYPKTIKRFNAGAEIAVIAGHGHFTGLEAPDWVNEVIIDWYKRHAFI